MGGDYPQYGEEHDLDSTVTIELTNKGNGILFTVVDEGNRGTDRRERPFGASRDGE